MKKYKLIKTYPNSPNQLGLVIEKNGVWWQSSFCITNDEHFHKHNNSFNPANYPEFWEEIVEYPIGTKAADSRINKIFTKKVDGWYNSNKTSHTDESINSAKWIEIVKDEVIDKNPLKLEIGKTYELQYIHCESTPFKAKITRLTTHGYLWMEKLDNTGNGIIIDSYNLIKEVIEKDYEILSFKDSINSIWKRKSGNPHTSFKSSISVSYATEGILLSRKCAIHSVLRKSDGEVFTVGDKVEGGIITKFFTERNSIFPVTDNSSCYYPNFVDLKHTKKPLFTTDDGVDIFEGDKYYMVSHITFQWKFWGNINYEFIAGKKECNHDYKNVKYFSTKEKAEEYILMNKPVFSLTDIHQFFPSSKTKSNKSRGKELYELVKQRI